MKHVHYKMKGAGLLDWHHYVSQEGAQLPEGAVVAEEPTPIGEERSTKLDGATRYVRDAVRRWSNGEEEHIKCYFQRDVPQPGHEDDDYCTYCGCNNGPKGQFRQGFDCAQCGGN